jgi:AraC-like DNA-binding protein
VIGVVETQSVAPQDRFEYWLSSTSEIFLDLRMRTPDPGAFFGSLRFQELGATTLFRLTSAACRTDRLAADRGGVDADGVKLMMPLRGRAMITQRDRACVLQPGDLSLTDLSAPYRVENRGPAQLLMLTLPVGLLHHDVRRVRAQAAMRVPAGDETARLIGPFLRSLGEALGREGLPATSQHLSPGIISLLRALYAARIDPDIVGARQAPEDLLHRIRAFIDANLGLPDLTPSAVASAHDISPRLLYKLFEREGTGVSEWIRARRLERCRRELADTSLRGESVLSIALRAGFQNSAHFSRLFKATYGISPREHRRVHAG